MWHAGSNDDTFPWASLYPDLSSQAGNCSSLISSRNTFDSNHAVDAGAVMYATNVSTVAMSCNAGQAAGNSPLSCPAPLWINNTVSSATGAVGYGAGVASQPASILLDAAPMKSYVSNGSVKLPLTVYVKDQTGLNVTAGNDCFLHHNDHCLHVHVSLFAP